MRSARSEVKQEEAAAAGRKGWRRTQAKRQERIKKWEQGGAERKMVGFGEREWHRRWLQGFFLAVWSLPLQLLLRTYR